VLQNIHGLALLGAVDVVTVGVDDAPERVERVREWQPFSLRTRSISDRVRTKTWPFRPEVYPGIDRYYSTRAGQWIRESVARRQYDVAVIEGLLMSSYLGDLARGGCRVVFDAHNVEDKLHEAVVTARPRHEASLVRRVKDRVLRRRMRQAENAAVRNADVVWACSEPDAREIETAYRTATPVTVIPNGVDVDTYAPAAAPLESDDWSDRPIVLFYSGSFAYAPNHQAAMRLVRDVLPAVRSRGFLARLLLVGRDPSPAMVAAASQDTDITVTGRVDHVLPYLEQPCIVTVPITLGSGTRLKIVEAFAAGRPVVSTAKGAEGIDGVDGEHFLVRESADAIAGAVIDLWHQPLLRNSICAKAQDLVRTRYSWAAAAQRIAESLAPSWHDARP
jgi:glycosyltransferase involved in cell wall biosynthesis